MSSPLKSVLTFIFLPLSSFAISPSMIRAATVLARRRIALNNLSKCSYATEAPMVHVQKPSIAGQPLFHTHPHLGELEFVDVSSKIEF
jgi:hypothetical protein